MRLEHLLSGEDLIEVSCTTRFVSNIIEKDEAESTKDKVEMSIK